VTIKENQGKISNNQGKIRNISVEQPQDEFFWMHTTNWCQARERQK
jgi:hypothetical protein